MALLNEKGQIVIAPDEIGDIMPIGKGMRTKSWTK